MILRLDFIALVETHETVVYKHTGKLIAYGFCHQSGCHGGVHAAAERQQHLAVAHLFPDGADGGFLVISHGPVAGGTAHLIEEVADHVGAVFRVIDLRMILHAVESPGLVADGNVGAGIGMGHQREALGHLLHIVAVAHPGNALGRQVLEQFAAGVKIGLRFAVFPGGVIGSGHNPAAQVVRDQLAAVANTQDRDTHLKNSRVHLRRLGVINAVGTAGEDDADGVEGLHRIQRRGIGLDLAIHTALTDAAGDQLIVLTAEIKDDDSLVRQGDSSFFKVLMRPPYRPTPPR